MADFFSEYGIFLAKSITVLAIILFLMTAALSNAMRSKKEDKGSINVRHLNKDTESLRDAIKVVVLDKESLKVEHKAEKKKHKAEKKEKKIAARQDSSDEPRKRVYVIDFEGDIKASEVTNMRKSITAILAIARPGQDEVLLRLESSGGMVHSYGLAASQLERIRKKKIPLTVCVDKVAASGGYMMACLGNKIVAAPFAIIGSVGVLVQLPNFYRLLKDKKIDYEMITAGEYKRTLTVFGENTEKGRKKMTEEIQEVHQLFKEFISEHRPRLNVDEIATGETWFGTRALEKNLIDEIKTSDECIADACENADVYQVEYQQKKKFSDRLSSILETVLDNTILKWLHQSNNKSDFIS